MRARDDKEPALLRWLRSAAQSGADLPRQPDICRRLGVGQSEASRMLSRMAARGEIIIERTTRGNRISLPEGARHG